MVERADVVVVGGGAMGLSTAWHLAAARRSVVLLERFAFGHARGSSHGRERIFRYGYADPAYVRLAKAAKKGWRRLEKETGQPLLDRFGCLDWGNEAELAAIAAACKAEGVKVKWRDGADEHGLRASGPVLWQPGAGRIRAEQALRALRVAATRAGASMRFNEQVTAIEPDGDGVTVRTEAGGYQAPVAVVTAGAWAGELLAGLVPDLPPLTVTEELVAYFRPAAGTPVDVSFVDRGRPTPVYGLPTPDGLVKIGEHRAGPVVTADTRTGAVDPAALARLAGYAAEAMPGVDPSPVRSLTCLYANTPTADFVLDRVGPLVVGAGFSGHGFKFVPEIGRLLAGMAAGETPPGAPFSSARAGV
ncbi:MAG: FAD-dependent oxidoreductase [Mycobacteriales bacterium]